MRHKGKFLLTLIPVLALAVSTAAAWQGCANGCSSDPQYPGCITNPGLSNPLFCTGGPSYCNLEDSFMCEIWGDDLGPGRHRCAAARAQDIEGEPGHGAGE